MSESHPSYISSAAGQNAFTDLLVRRSGDYVEIVGHPAVLLTEQEAEKLADTIRDICLEISVAKMQQPTAAFLRALTSAARSI
jgi:hypothetical protein